MVLAENSEDSLSASPVFSCRTGHTAHEVMKMLHMFLLGAAGYPLLELLYRRRTHYSMALAGGASAVLIRSVSRMKICLPVKAALCGLGITGVEALCGCIWNREHQVWDYRRLPLNWKGHICLPYSLLWCTLSTGMLIVMNRLKK